MKTLREIQLEAQAKKTSAEWIKDMNRTAREMYRHAINSECAIDAFTEGAQFGRSYEARKVEALIAAIEDIRKYVNSEHRDNSNSSMQIAVMCNRALTNYESTRDQADKGEE